jgi:oxygen-independent coproporphyrinogen-3 oxidase
LAWWYAQILAIGASYRWKNRKNLDLRRLDNWTEVCDRVNERLSKKINHNDQIMVGNRPVPGFNHLVAHLAEELESTNERPDFEIRNVNSLPFQMVLIHASREGDLDEGPQETPHSLVSYVGSNTYSTILSRLRIDVEIGQDGYNISTLLDHLHSCVHSEDARIWGVLNKHFLNLWNTAILVKSIRDLSTDVPDRSSLYYLNQTFEDARIEKLTRQRTATETKAAGTALLESAPYKRDPCNFEIIYNYPPANEIEEVGDISKFDFSEANPKGIYVHIPFCAGTCTYCHYTRKQLDDEDELNQFLSVLSKEIALWGEKLKPRCGGSVRTIYFGGGTPTILSPDQITEITNNLHKAFGIEHPENIIENTWESSPETLAGGEVEPTKKLEAMKKAGVNRLSIGIQTFESHLLEICGRSFTFEDVKKIIDAARIVGFRNINLDLMFCLPTQKVEHWKQTIEQVISLEPEAVSVHQLRLKPNTPLYEHESYRSEIPGEEERLEMTIEAHKLFAKAGYIHETSEVDVFLKDKIFHHQHQKDKWVFFYDLIGIGPAAYGYLNNISYFNQLRKKDYYQAVESGKLPIYRAKEMSLDDRMARTMVLGLTFYEGVSRSDFKSAFGKRIEQQYSKLLDRLIKQGLVEIVDDRVCLTETGSYYSVEVRGEFYLSEHKEGPGSFGSYFKDFAFDSDPDEPVSR